MIHEKLVIINIYLKGVTNFLGDAKFFFEVYIYIYIWAENFNYFQMQKYDWTSFELEGRPWHKTRMDLKSNLVHLGQNQSGLT